MAVGCNWLSGGVDMHQAPPSWATTVNSFTFTFMCILIILEASTCLLANIPMSITPQKFDLLLLMYQLFYSTINLVLDTIMLCPCKLMKF